MAELKPGEVPDIMGTIKQASNPISSNVEPVVSRPGTLKKESGLSKIFKSLVATDAKNVKDYLIFDVLIPSIKNAIGDLIVTATNMTLWGKSGKRYGGGYGGYFGNSFDYGKMYKGNGFNASGILGKTQRQEEPMSEALDFNEIIFADRYDAEKVYTKMCERIAEYGLVTVSNFFRFSGLDPQEVVAENWGWYDLPTRTIEPYKGAWILRLPQAVKLR